MPFDPEKLKRVKAQFDPSRLAKVKTGSEPPTVEREGALDFLANVAKLGPNAAVMESVAKENGFLRKPVEKVVESPALPIAGSVVGGLAGAPSGPGAIGGAALGGAAGEAWRQIAARAMGLDAPKTSLEAAKDIGIEGAVQGAAEGAGRFVVAPVLKASGRALKKPAGDLFKIVTKIDPKDAATLFKNPGAILPKAWEGAKAAWKSAAQKAGIDVNEVSPALVKALKTGAKDTVFDTFERMQAGLEVTAGQAELAKKALDIAVMPAAKTERNRPLMAILGDMRKAFVKRIGEESPELAAANKEYAIAKAGKRFRSFFPRNLDDTPAYFRSSVLPSLLFGFGAGSGNYGEGARNAGIAATASSPLAIGSLISLAGGLRGAASVLGKSLMASLANLAGDKLRRRGNE